MKPQALIRLSFNLLRNILLCLSHKGKYKFHYLSFCSVRSTIRVGKGEISFGRSLQVEEHCYFSTQAGGKLTVGNNTFFNHHCQIISRGFVGIGDNCVFGPFVSIYDHDHIFGVDGVIKNDYRIREVKIGNNCWIGEKVTILRGSFIGDGCVIGAGCVISGNVPPHTLVKPQRNYNFEKLVE